MLALTTMLVGLITSLAMLQAGISYYYAETSRSKKSAAMNMAEAGINYAYWQVQYSRNVLPYSATYSSSNGQFSVTAVEDGARCASTMLVTSTGTVGKQSFVTRRIMQHILEPYDYAWCENTDITGGQVLTSTGVSGGMRTNGRISLSNSSANITTGGWAVTTVGGTGNVSPKYANSPSVTFSSVNYGNYSSIATRIYNNNTTFNSLNYANNSALIYVNGSATISGTYSGVCTVVATNGITVNGPLSPGDSNSFLALISDHPIQLNAGAGSIQAIIYSHKSDNSGTINMHNPQTIVGSMAADNITTDSSVAMSRDSRVTYAIMQQLHLP